jgi:hypothetical protein
MNYDQSLHTADVVRARARAIASFEAGITFLVLRWRVGGGVSQSVMKDDHYYVVLSSPGTVASFHSFPLVHCQLKAKKKQRINNEARYPLCRRRRSMRLCSFSIFRNHFVVIPLHVDGNRRGCNLLHPFRNCSS